MSPSDIMVRSIFPSDRRNSLLAHAVHYPFSCSLLYSHPSGCAAEQDKAAECRYHADMCPSLNRDKRAARFVSSGHGDNVQWTWSSTTPEKIPDTHTCKDQGSCRLISQRISNLHGLIDQYRSAGSKCSSTAFEVSDLC